MPNKAHGWMPKLKKNAGPLYLAIANAIAEDIAIGQLSPEQRLPPQRKLAQLLDVDFTTVARAYTEAHRRGLVDSVVGRGTFVCGKRRPKLPRVFEGRPNVDMSMNMPPEAIPPDLQQLMQSGIAEIGQNIHDLMRYQNFGGSHEDREAGCLWLRRRGLTINPERLLVVPGAQCALLAVLTVLAPAGSVICCEELTYPGLRALAGVLGIKLIGLPMDSEGIDAVAFAAACAQYAPKALYCNPTLLNPTTATMSAARRLVLSEVARHYSVPIVEDDAYGLLPRNGPPTIISTAPENTFYIAGLAKSVGAGLRIAYLVAPDENLVARLSSSLRATTVMASPFTSALATRWIKDGTADLMLGAIRKESTARQKMAAGILPAGSYLAHPEGFHLWIKIPQPWNQTMFTTHLRESGISAVPSDAFTVAGTPPPAMRVCVGGMAGRDEIRHALELIAEKLVQVPKVEPAVV